MEIDEVDISPYEWGRGITKGEWLFIQDKVEQYGVNKVIEFGPGLSTILFGKLGLTVKTFEVDEKWVENVDFGPDCEVVIWNGTDFPGKVAKYDLAFVDGPYGGENRSISTVIASLSSDLVLIHDCRRPNEKKWQGLYLEKDFEKNGSIQNICLWKRRRI